MATGGDKWLIKAEGGGINVPQMLQKLCGFIERRRRAGRLHEVSSNLVDDVYW